MQASYVVQRLIIKAHIIITARQSIGPIHGLLNAWGTVYKRRLEGLGVKLMKASAQRYWMRCFSGCRIHRCVNNRMTKWRQSGDGTPCIFCLWNINTHLHHKHTCTHAHTQLAPPRVVRAKVQQRAAVCTVCRVWWGTSDYIALGWFGWIV
jgi:hypothetical protein